VEQKTPETNRDLIALRGAIGELRDQVTKAVGQIDKLASIQDSMGSLLKEHHAFITNLDNLFKGAPKPTVEPAPAGAPPTPSGNPMNDMIGNLALRAMGSIISGQSSGGGLLNEKTMIQFQQVAAFVDAIRGGKSTFQTVMERSFARMMFEKGLASKEQYDKMVTEAGT
jgi:hypothetical protein